MKNPFSLHLEGVSFGYDELICAQAATALDGYHSLTDYSKSCLSFCHAWLRGQEVFEQQTSGSTGKPKKIRISRKQMQASAAMTARALGLQPGYRALVCLGTDYVAGKMMLVRAMEVGMRAYVVLPSSQPLIELGERMDFVALVPLQLNNMLEEKAEENISKLNMMQALLLGGAPLSLSLEEKIRQYLSAPVYHSYGMTETVSHIALRSINGVQASESYRILPGVEVQQDERGCLMVKGAVTEGQWLLTNDLIAMTSAESFRWLGRADFVINSGGVKLFTEQVEKKIEQVMLKVKLNNLFFVAGLPDEKLGQKVVLLLEGKAPGSEELEKLKLQLRQHLSPYELPREIRCMPHFARTHTGKLDRKATLNLAVSGT